jgi:putative oxidoreductase
MVDAARPGNFGGWLAAPPDDFRLVPKGALMNQRMQDQIQFLIEIDKVKHIFRRTIHQVHGGHPHAEYPPDRWGLIFMQHGTQKLFGFLAVQQVASPPLWSLIGLAGVLEFFGGLFLFLGLFFRPVAFILSGEMAVAYFMVHAPKGFWSLRNGGDLAVILCLLFLYLAVVGGGAWSLDRLGKRDHNA